MLIARGVPPAPSLSSLVAGLAIIVARAVVIITAGAWTMLTVATFLSGTMMAHVNLGLRLGGGAALAILTPALVLSQLTIHNAAEPGSCWP